MDSEETTKTTLAGDTSAATGISGETPASSRTGVNIAKRSRLKNNWLIAAIVLVFVGGIIWSVGIARFLEFLYNPAAIVLVVILMIEYILLQGRDRTRIYKIELEKLRVKRSQDIEFMRNLEMELKDLDESLSPLIKTMSGEASNNLQHIRDDLGSLRKGLSEKI